MGHQFTIESDEAFALATELAGLTGQSIEDVIAETLRSRVEKERARKADYERAKAAVAEFHKFLEETGGTEGLSSDHSWLYDEETGLPI